MGRSRKQVHRISLLKRSRQRERGRAVPIRVN
uniref:Uncharacterized protein n=1 Tax=Anguilla anguilla TaxID=7936 RepID=A0A0E9TPS2_ANGAN